jgi:hypothetical protein
MHTHVYEATSLADPRCRTCGMTQEEAAISDLKRLVGEIEGAKAIGRQGYSAAQHYANEAMQNLRAAIS